MSSIIALALTNNGRLALFLCAAVATITTYLEIEFTEYLRRNNKI